MDFTNETTVERIIAYVDEECYEEAEGLVRVANFLEECYWWDVNFE